MQVEKILSTFSYFRPLWQFFGDFFSFLFELFSSKEGNFDRIFFFQKKIFTKWRQFGTRNLPYVRKKVVITHRKM
jgi:hypothetical protein